MGMYRERYVDEFWGRPAAIEVQAASSAASALAPEYVMLKLVDGETILFHQFNTKQDFHALVHALRKCGQACGWEFPQE